MQYSNQKQSTYPHLIDAIAGYSRDFKIEDRIFNFLLLIAAIGRFSSGIVYGVIGFSTPVAVSACSLGLLYFGFYYLVRAKRKHPTLIKILTLLTALPIFSWLWIKVGGLSGPSGYGYIFICLTITVTLRGRVRWAMLGLAAANLFALIVLDLSGAFKHLSSEPQNVYKASAFIIPVILVLTLGLVYILTQSLQESRLRVQQMLLNILPEKIAEELQTYNSVVPKYCMSASILFTDFEGFTKLAESLKAREIVDLLDEIFCEFDQIVERHGLEKLKTIGDSYMCVGGIPEFADDHADKVVNAGYEMLQFMENFNRNQRRSGKPELPIRIGIHSGPVVAGIIGKNKFAYDVWGNTVNIASRLESACPPGKLNISAQTYDELKEKKLKFKFEGNLRLNAHSEVDMYSAGTNDPLSPAA